MKRPLLKLFLLSAVVAAIHGCGGGGGNEPAATGPAESPSLAEGVAAEGVAAEAIPPEDLDFADRSLVPLTFIAVTPPAGGHTGSAWVAWPESLAINVLDENNQYAHTEQALSWPSGGAGIYSSRADCSGYVTRSLMKAFGFTADHMAAWTGSRYPSSARYHDNIRFENNFVRVQQVSAIQRGDILAAKYLDNHSGGTGHTMIAAAAPVLRATPTKPVIEGTVQYELRIIDSTSSPHGTGDTRKGTGAAGADQDGAGIGTMRLYADAATGNIAGYSWSLSTGSVYYTATSPADDRRSLMVGRMTFTQ